MDAPKCQFCGKREWRHICAEVVTAKPKVVTPVAVVVTEAPAVVTPKAESRHGKYRDEKRRAEYLRIYMKTKRAIESGRAVAIR